MGAKKFVENPYKWSSIENLPSVLHMACKYDEERRSSSSCYSLRSITERSFDVYEKMDGTNVGIVAWPPEDLGQLYGRNFAIPQNERAYQHTPLDQMRDENTIRNSLSMAQKLIERISTIVPPVHSNTGDSSVDGGDICRQSCVKNVIIYGELIIQGRSECFGYGDRGVRAGDFYVFGAMIVCRDASGAFACIESLRSREGFCVKSRLQDNSAVQICLNGAFEDWMATNAPYFRVPRCFSRELSFFEVLGTHGPRLIEDCEGLEGIVLTCSSTDVKEQMRQQRIRCRDVIYKWKTGLTDDSTCERHLSKMRDALEQNKQTPEYVDEWSSVSDCVHAFLDVYEKNPVVKARRQKGRLNHSVTRTSKEKAGATVGQFDKRRLELIVNNELTKFESGVLHDISVDKEERRRVALDTVEKAVNEFFTGYEDDSAFTTLSDQDKANIHKALKATAHKMVWSLSKET